MKKSLTISHQVPELVTIKQEVRFGKPTIAGTRVTIEDLLSLLESGYGINEIPEQLPTVKIAAIKQALRYTAQIMGREEVLSIHG